MSNHDCLSLLEILELRDASNGSEQQEHIANCARCRALLANLPNIETLETRSFGAMSGGVVRESLAAPVTAAGEIWIARAAGNDDWRFPVAIIGGSRQREGVVIVAPLGMDLEQATDSDLVVTSHAATGYPFFVAVWNFGQVYEAQLEECIGALEPDLAEQLQILYRHVAGDEAAVPGSIGPSILSRKDPRRIYRNEINEKTRELYAQARAERVEETVEAKGVEESEVESETFGRVLTQILRGEEWDKTALLESAHLEASQLDQFVADQLDLTMKTDIEPLARTLSSLHFELDQVRQPIWNSLAVSGGGWPEASGESFSIAARSFSHVSNQQRAHDLFRDQMKVDESDEGRRRAIEDYWHDLVEKFEEIAKR